MFLIFGIGTKAYRLGAPVLRCPHCGATAAQVVWRRARRFTLFFIPLIPLGSTYAMQCTNCAATSRLSREEADKLTGH
jgi:hypothetical protein